MPQDVPCANYLEGIVYGSDVTLVDGLISDCARMVGERIKQQKEANTPAAETWFDISTLRSPTASKAKRPWGTS
jgi:threonine synthase